MHKTLRQDQAGLCFLKMIVMCSKGVLALPPIKHVVLTLFSLILNDILGFILTIADCFLMLPILSSLNPLVFSLSSSRYVLNYSLHSRCKMNTRPPFWLMSFCHFDRFVHHGEILRSGNAIPQTWRLYSSISVISLSTILPQRYFFDAFSEQKPVCLHSTLMKCRQMYEFRLFLDEFALTTLSEWIHPARIIRWLCWSALWWFS